ncbi:hypothetical protein BGZ76_005290 [Entomortierella beljakovae]|nr:hypothetical protein BGZ76_005290 [Entomortierella beljakovae]
MSRQQPKTIQNVHSIEIPEVMSMIASHLVRKDITACARVSKEWSKLFEAHLWKDVVFPQGKHIPPLETLSKYTRYTRSLRLSGPDQIMAVSISFPHLQKLDLTYFPGVESFAPHALSLNPTIEDFSLGGEVSLGNIHFWESVSKLQHLKKIFVTEISIGNKVFKKFWEAICKVEVASFLCIKLRIGISSKMTTVPNIKSLKVNSLFGQPKELSAFVEKCSGLESLDWPGELDIVGNISRNTWPNLHQIQLSGLDLTKSGMCTILTSLTKVTVLEIRSASWGLESFNALSRHFRTLEVFRDYSPKFTSVMVNTVMSSCPNLYDLKAEEIDGNDIINDNRINKAEQPDGAWVCTGLKYLELRFNLEAVDSQIPILEKMACLTELIRLDINPPSFYDSDYRSLRFSLDNGLDILKPLKNLSQLTVRGTRQGISDKDKAWIAANWRFLRYINT